MIPGYVRAPYMKRASRASATRAPAGALRRAERLPDFTAWRLTLPDFWAPLSAALRGAFRLALIAAWHGCAATREVRRELRQDGDIAVRAGGGACPGQLHGAARCAVAGLVRRRRRRARGNQSCRSRGSVGAAPGNAGAPPSPGLPGDELPPTQDQVPPPPGAAPGQPAAPPPKVQAAPQVSFVPGQPMVDTNPSR
jgi:hypothetical protein